MDHPIPVGSHGAGLLASSRSASTSANPPFALQAVVLRSVWKLDVEEAIAAGANAR